VTATLDLVVHVSDALGGAILATVAEVARLRWIKRQRRTGRKRTRSGDYLRSR
jgi:hypothetical protein